MRERNVSEVVSRAKKNIELLTLGAQKVLRIFCTPLAWDGSFTYLVEYGRSSRRAVARLRRRFVLTSLRHVLRTGCAGTGKSLVLTRILETLAEAGTTGVYATATTGIAACHVKGTTLQQFSGFGKARGTGEEMLKAVRKRPDAVKRYGAGSCG